MLYSELASVYGALEATSKRLEKAAILAKLLKGASDQDLEQLMYLIQGRVFAPWDERKIGMSSKLMLKAIALATGNPQERVVHLWKKIGDLGVVAEQLIHKKKQKTLVSRGLDVKKVFDNIRAMSTLTGAGTVAKKINLVAELLTSAKPLEARYIVRTVLEELRIGVAQGIVRDAIAQAYNVNVKDVERAFSILVDYGEVAKKAKKKQLGKVTLGVGRPTEVMLAIRVESIGEAFKAVGKPAQFEYKLDGFRVQVHKQAGKILLFTRRMENVTKQFAEILPILEKNVKANSYILDAELAGYSPKTKKYLPFQNISQRIKRKYDIEKIAKEFPVEVNVFDILYCNGKSLIAKPFKERRKILERIIKQDKWKIVLTPKLVTASEKEAELFYKEALKTGNEGIMIKKLDAVYQPGRRVEGWVKYKPVMETLDLVIIGAQWGEGKRATWLSSFDLACHKNGNFLEVGKVGTGIKEKGKGVTFQQLTRELKPYILKEKGKHVQIKPKLVVEVAYEEIQRSPTYTSGLALRFPRILRIRFDRAPEECDTLERVKTFFAKQRRK